MREADSTIYFSDSTRHHVRSIGAHETPSGGTARAKSLSAWSVTVHAVQEFQRGTEYSRAYRGCAVWVDGAGISTWRLARAVKLESQYRGWRGCRLQGPGQGHPNRS